MKKENKIIIIDDHYLMRDAIVNRINNFDGYKVVASLNNGAELTEDIMKHNPDIIILDVSMPKKDGYATSDWLKEKYPECKVLILTMYDSEIVLLRLLQKGARGFLKKDVHPKELKNALDAVMEHGFYYSQDMSGKLVALFFKKENIHLEKTLLSENEIKFLKLVSTDLTYKEIAEEMNVSPRAIDAYRDSLFIKLDQKSRVGLAVYSFKNGIVTG